MSEWASCPHCGLKHSLRVDGLCPRCRQAVGGAAPPPLPEQALEQMPAGAPPPLPPQGGGGTLYSGPVAGPAGGMTSQGNIYAPPRSPSALAAPPVLATLQATAPDEVPWGARLAGGVFVLNSLAILFAMSKGVKLAGPPVSAIVDMIVGGMLIAGAAKALKWAQVRTVLGAIIFPIIILASQGSTTMAFVQIAFSGALLALLLGDAGTLRIGVAMTFLGLYMAVAIGG
jgi:hypothetical protein